MKQRCHEPVLRFPIALDIMSNFRKSLERLQPTVRDGGAPGDEEKPRDYNWAMADVTQILSQIEQGNPAAAEQLLPLVYEELRKLAAAKMISESPGHTLQATALVHEAYLRLVNVDPVRHWHGREHFLAVAAIAMRRILTDWARKKGASKRGGKRLRIDLDDIELMSQPRPDTVVAVDEALEQLAAHNPQAARVAEMRLFSGLSFEEIALSLGMSSSTCHRLWLYARASLHDAITQSP